MLVKLLIVSLFIGLSIGDVILFEKNNDYAVKFSFASYYQNHMVLQMQPYSAVLWGFGSIGAKVEVALGQDKYQTEVYMNVKKVGVWKVLLKPHPAGGPVTISASQTDSGVVSKIQLTDILFGDVWICSGQSNMEFTVSMGINASEELKHSSQYTSIRVMTPAEVVSDVPLDDFQSIEQSWSLPSSESLGGPRPWTYFSAVCWYYGKYLYESLKIPIGLVSPNWGGTPVECWSSPAALEKCNLNHVLDKLEFVKPPVRVVPTANSVLWNAMIHPLLNMTIKGAIWYQGEANANYHNSEYSCSFPAMIADWRTSWYEGTSGQTHSQFPFGFVQLSTNNVADNGAFSLIRWHQTGDFGYVPNPKMPNTFMAVAMDLGNYSSPFGAIHPTDKQDVGARLGIGALNVAYGQHVNPYGPYPTSTIRTGDGHVVVTYPNDQQLVLKGNGTFQVCCSYSTCLIDDPPVSSNWVRAPIVSHTHRSITLEAQICINGGGEPVLLRYAWSLTPCDFKQCPVYNDADLPAPPFIKAVIDL